MSTIKKLFLGSVTRTLLSIVQMTIGFFMMPFLVNHLGDKWYGVWTVLGSTVAYMYMMDFGFSQAVILYLSRHIATKDHDKANTVINTSLGIYCGLSLGVLAVSAIVATFIEAIVGVHNDVSLISMVVMVLGASLAIEFPFNSFSGIVGAYVRYELLSYSRFFVLITNTVLTVYFIGSGYGILAMAWIGLFCCVLSNILFFTISKYCFRELKISPRFFDRSIVRELTNYSFWSFINNVSYLLKFRLNSIIISIFLGPVAVTHYFVGSRLADYFRDLLFQATNLSTPILTRYHVLDQLDELREKLRFLTKINAVLAFFGGGVILIVGKAFIAKWMGDSYLDAFPILVILVTAMMVEITIDPARCTMSAMGQNRFVAVLEMAEGVLNVILSIILIKFYGSTGVALGTAIPLILLKLLIVPAVICRRIQMAPSLFYRAIAPIVLVTLIYIAVYGAFAQTYLLTSSYLSIVAVGAAAVPIYAGLVYLLFFNRGELEMLLKLLPWKKG